MTWWLALLLVLFVGPTIVWIAAVEGARFWGRRQERRAGR